MSMVQEVGAVALPRRCFVRSFILHVTCLFAFAGVLIVGASAAHAFEVITTPSDTQAQAAAVMRAPAEPAGDSCLYILRQAQERDSVSVREKYYRQQAGSAAALGLVFGVRFALGPAEVQKTRRARSATPAAFQVWETQDGGGAQALAIADYRACRNEQTLRALTD